jgi:hypothetical protein
MKRVLGYEETVVITVQLYQHNHACVAAPGA